MITLYSGTPGAGKSLHLAEVLYYRVKNYKGVVIGNFDLNTGNIKGRHKGKYISITIVSLRIGSSSLVNDIGNIIMELSRCRKVSFCL